jgi:hypothetical protein
MQLDRCHDVVHDALLRLHRPQATTPDDASAQDLWLPPGVDAAVGSDHLVQQLIHLDHPIFVLGSVRI